jgi:hypothetical protein
MKLPMTATKAFAYAGRRLSAGDEFEAPRQDARALAAVGRASYRTADIPAAPVQKMPEPPPGPEGDNDLPALRKEYEAVFGKRPFHGWGAETLVEKIIAKRAGG